MSDITVLDQQKVETSGEPLANEQKANDLSWLTEGADGFRKKMALIVDAQKNLILVMPNEVGGRRLIAWVNTPNHQDRQQVEVICRIEGSKKEIPLPSADNYDAVFWTESSIEKFLYPYYHSQRLWDENMDKLKREFDEDESAVAIAHMAPSKSFKVSSLKVGIATKAGEIDWVSMEEYLLSKSSKAGKPSPTT
jgi:hypothetical protein